MSLVLIILCGRDVTVDPGVTSIVWDWMMYQSILVVMLVLLDRGLMSMRKYELAAVLFFAKSALK